MTTTEPTSNLITLYYSRRNVYYSNRTAQKIAQTIYSSYTTLILQAICLKSEQTL